MTATYPIVERIAQEIVARLAAVTIENGYQVDIGTIHRPIRIGNVGDLGYVPTDLSAAVEQIEREDVVEEEGNPTTKTLRQWFGIPLYRASAADDSDVPLDQKINVFQADVELALTLGKTPTANWQQFELEDGSCLAVDAKIGEPEWFELIDLQMAGVTVKMAVDYRTPVNDPYTAIG